MSDLIEEGPGLGPGNAPEFTVSELTGAVKKTIEGAFGRVRVRGEIGRVSRPRSGHVYFDIKDDRNVVACTTWKGQVAGLGMEPEEGLEVIVTGRLSTYGPQSRYNLNVDRMEMAGVGALMAMLEKRRKALAAEGLFDEAKKRPLPYLPNVIGVVTSPSGAVIRDILHRLRDRFPRQVVIWPVAVQGAASAPEVSRAIRGFNALPIGGPIPRPDLVIVARGGGSLEDLWGFNEEAVVRAAAESDIPLISAVGHETDTTLIDLAADRRAPTPTAAAELAVPVRLDLLGWVQTQGGRLTRAAGEALTRRRQRLGDLSRALPRPDAVLETPRQRLDRAVLRLGPALNQTTQKRRLTLNALAGRLGPAQDRILAARRLALGQRAARLSPGILIRSIGDQRALLTRLVAQQARAITHDQDRRHQRLETAARLLQSLGYTATLARGYAVVRSQDAIVTTAAMARGAERLEIEFADGQLVAQPMQDTPRPGAKPALKQTPKPKPGPGGQGDLFGG